MRITLPAWKRAKSPEGERRGLRLVPPIATGPGAAAYDPAAPRDLVVLLDGTLCSLAPDELSNIGLIHSLLSELPDGARPHVHYEPGLRWRTWRRWPDVITGRGINRQIRRAYGFLAARYRPGDRIFLLGFSRGAFAVRSLAGVIDRVGLLCGEYAVERHVRQIYRYYRSDPHGEAARAYAAAHCHRLVEIEFVGVFDTVKALGLRLPLLWRLTEPAHDFHSPHLGDAIRHGAQALALDETRAAFDPLIWETPPAWRGRVEQMWFRGCHRDVGGRAPDHAARGLGNIPLNWMLDQLALRGLTLPAGWHTRFPGDVDGPSAGTWRGWGKLFLIRHRRRVGRDASERLHPTASHPGQAADGGAAGEPA